METAHYTQIKFHLLLQSVTMRHTYTLARPHHLPLFAHTMRTARDLAPRIRTTSREGRSKITMIRTSPVRARMIQEYRLCGFLRLLILRRNELNLLVPHLRDHRLVNRHQGRPVLHPRGTIQEEATYRSFPF